MYLYRYIILLVQRPDVRAVLVLGQNKAYDGWDDNRLVRVTWLRQVWTRNHQVFTCIIYWQPVVFLVSDLSVESVITS